VHKAQEKKRPNLKLPIHEETDMKAKLLVTALVAAFSMTAFAQTTAPSPVQEVKQDNKDIRKDNRDIRNDKRDIRSDKRVLAGDVKQRNADQRAEDRDLKNGNVAGAEKMEKARETEQHEINHDKRDLHKDRKDLHQDRKDKKEDVKQRNHDAAQIK
jgi:hypothetical protein